MSRATVLGLRRSTAGDDVLWCVGYFVGFLPTMAAASKRRTTRNGLASTPTSSSRTFCGRGACFAKTCTPTTPSRSEASKCDGGGPRGHERSRHGTHGGQQSSADHAVRPPATRWSPPARSTAGRGFGYGADSDRRQGSRRASQRMGAADVLRAAMTFDRLVPRGVTARHQAATLSTRT